MEESIIMILGWDKPLVLGNIDKAQSDSMRGRGKGTQAATSLNERTYVDSA